MEKYKYYKRKINYYETDKMAVVHHSNYARLLEETRIDMMAYYGISLELFEELGYMIPVLTLSSSFIGSVRYGDTVKIVPKIEKVSNVKFFISYTIYDENMKNVLHRAESSHCFLDSNFKPVSLKKEQPELFAKLQALVEAQA